MNLVTHFIAGYPDLEASFETARGLIDGGAVALEMQIPFSDPSADGPVIEDASRKSLERGFRVADAFSLVERILEYADTPVYIMSYSAIVFNMGISTFCGAAANAGAAGLIIPDLTPGNDEGLYAEGRAAGLDVIPVIVPGVTDVRLDEIMSEKPSWVYLALRSGITGSYTELDETNLGFLERLKRFDTKIMAGFGIRSPKQVKLLEPHSNAAVVGSFIVKKVSTVWDGSEKDKYNSVRKTSRDAVQYLLC